MNNELQTIPISSLYESPENSRHVFDEPKLKELAQSIQAQGIKVRLIVRQGEDGKFEIVAGARRYRAAQLAGQAEVPCEIREYTDAEAGDARLIENLQRADLTPLKETESYQQRLAVAIEEGKPSPPPSWLNRSARTRSTSVSVSACWMPFRQSKRLFARRRSTSAMGFGTF